MSDKAVDRKGRWRARTVSFRASEEEIRMIDQIAKLSGLSKQSYIISRLIQRDIIVKGNPRVFKALKDSMLDILEELKRIQNSERPDEELLETINIVSEIFKGMISPEKEVAEMDP